MYLLREMQTGMSYGCRRHGQFEEQKKRHGMHPLHGVRKELSKRRALMNSDLSGQISSGIIQPEADTRNSLRLLLCPFPAA